MSAFLVSDNHLHAICSFASNLRFLGLSLPDHVDLFVALKQANVLALHDRYGDPAEKVAKPRPKIIKLPVLAVLKACQCLDYQCSDWSGWKESFAKKHLDLIVSAGVMELPGYEEAEWAIA